MTHAPHRPDGREIWCGRFDRRGPSRRAVHDYSAIVLFLEGRVWIDQDGRWEALPGDVQLVPAGTPHAHLEGEGQLLGVSFCAACLRADGLGELLEPFDAVRSGRAPLLRPPDEGADRLRAILQGLEEECQRPGKSSLRARRAWLELALIELSRLEQTASVSASAGIVSEALAWLEAHALEPITPSDVAKALRRSPTHLTTAVREQTGQTVGQWIVALRMAEARRRLRETDERVDTIGERVGYPDPSHFSRVFRRVHGCSPTQWRRNPERGVSPSAPSSGCD